MAAKADVREAAKVVVMDVDVVVALSAAHARTRTANPWTTRKRL